MNRKDRRIKKKKKRGKFNRKEAIRKAKEENPNQNAINLSSKVLTTPQKSVLAKGTFFIPSLNDVNWLNHNKKPRKVNLETWAVYIVISLVSQNLMNGPKHRESILKIVGKLRRGSATCRSFSYCYG